jgi:hypothetical protein
VLNLNAFAEIAKMGASTETVLVAVGTDRKSDRRNLPPKKGIAGSAMYGVSCVSIYPLVPLNRSRPTIELIANRSAMAARS